LACTFVEAAVVTLVNRVKAKLGGQPQFNSFDIFLKLFLLHMLGRQSKLRITCKERTDGAGAQAHTMMSAINFARAYGHTYVHTPFVEIDHADRPMGEWVEAWEKLFNLGENEERFEPESPGVLNYSTFHPRLYHAVYNVIQKIGARTVPSRDEPESNERHFQPFFFYSDSHPDSYSSVMPELRNKYYANESPVRNEVTTVAVHLRRGDVTPDHPQRFTQVDTVYETTRLVKSILDDCQEAHAISVYTQGKRSDFAEFQKIGADLYVSVDAVWTMQQMVEADVLIMSKSSFSYVAALVSDGIKLYEPFWHSPLEHWIALKSTGSFDRAAFEGQLRQLLKARQSA
jgi:hypothetical protein